MTEQRYFRPRNWGKYQSKSNNSMAWVKVQTAILSDYDFNELTEIQQLLWIKLLLLFGRTARPQPWDSGFIARELNQDYRGIARGLKALHANKFIELCNRTQNLHSELLPLEESRGEKKERKAATQPKERRSAVADAASPKPEKPLPPKGTHLPADWLLTEPDIRHAREKGFLDEQTREIATAFHNHFTAGPGRAKTWTDWHRCFCNWLAKERPRNGTNGNRQKPTGVVATYLELRDEGAFDR